MDVRQPVEGHRREAQLRLIAAWRRRAVPRTIGGPSCVPLARRPTSRKRSRAAWITAGEPRIFSAWWAATISAYSARGLREGRCEVARPCGGRVARLPLADTREEARRAGEERRVGLEPPLVQPVAPLGTLREESAGEGGRDAGEEVAARRREEFRVHLPPPPRMRGVPHCMSR
jgi:hypothetical protein